MVDHSEQPPHVRQWHQVLNWHCPADAGRYRDRPNPQRVRVRVVWGDEDGFVAGEQWPWGTMTRWSDQLTHVYVRLDDSGGRLAGQGVWVKYDDVYHPSPGAPFT